MPNFNPPPRNVVSGVLALAMMWSCPCLSASVATTALTANPTTIAFGDTVVGNTQTQSGTLTNSQATSVTITQAWVSGSEFQVSGLSLPLTLESGQSVTFSATFTPTISGSVVGAIFVTAIIASSQNPTVNYNGALSIPLLGAGTTPPSALQPSSPSLNFGNVQVGSSATRSETLTNSGASSVSITEANITDSTFTVTGLNLPLTLPPGQSFTFAVIFAPSSASAVTGSISVVSNASNSTLSIALSGTGAAPGQLSLAPTSLDFGSVVVGRSTSLAATLTATGSSVTISSATSNSSEYTVSGLSLPLPLTLIAGQSISLSFTFTPQASGSNTGKVSFISNASNSPTVEFVAGSGTLSSPHQVDLSWNPSTSAVVGYNVYRSGTSGGPYGKINSLPRPTTGYTDNTVEAGLTYYYVTTAVDASGGESVYSNEVQAVVPTP